MQLRRFLSKTSYYSLINETNKKRCQELLLSKPNLSKSYKNSAVLVPLCIVNDELSLLFTVRTHHLPTHKGQVSFPGGKVDDSDNKDPIKTALREAKEEVGINESDVDVWGTMFRLPARHGMAIHPVLGVLKNPLNLDSLSVNTGEVAKVFTVTLSELSRHARYTIWKERSIALPVYNCPGKDKVWGFTAMVTHLALKLVTPDLYKFDLP
ncbi:unnamed protein product [Dimorphilus gyrociliatus]|uniref:Nudix hydrolase domain-containing protein n=1 Tax=Dimorphilus gyrociliatus TaxID=2664684 RepID=A0A7I8VMW0_9ANNE|nr:unnamed protein product [Dimorphilus gyrociliatus]